MYKVVYILAGWLICSLAWGLTDPTQPKAGYESLAAQVQSGSKTSGVGSSSALRLQSVLKQGNSYSAVINGKVYRKGDKVDGYQVTKIAASTVVLEGSGRKVVLSLFKAKNKLKIESNE